MKDNKLIAEFMGLKPCDDREQYQSSIYTNVVADLKYHTSWDWLMPVVDKIESIGFEFQILKGTCLIQDEDSTETLVETYSHNKQKATYKAVTEFIKEKVK